MGVHDNDEFWGPNVVRAYLKLASTRAARTQMDRWGVPRAAPGPDGERRWRQTDVVAAAQARPGRGRRTDIQRPNIAYVAEMILSTGQTEITRQWLRDEWVRRYPDDRESRYPASQRGAYSWTSQGSYAAVRVRDALHRLAKEGAIERHAETITVLDSPLLAQIAQRLINPEHPADATGPD